MSENLNNNSPSWQEINEKLSSASYKRKQLYLGTTIFLFSCLFLVMLGLINAPNWETRVDMLTGAKAEKPFMFLMTGFFISPYLIGWPFLKLRELIISPLLKSQSFSEWVSIAKRVKPIYLASFIIQLFVGYLLTTFAYYFLYHISKLKPTQTLHKAG